jgi:hypothetical protein
MLFLIPGGGADGVVFGCLTPEGEVRLPSSFTEFHFYTRDVLSVPAISL